MSRHNVLITVAIGALCGAVSTMDAAPAAAGDDELNIMSWCDLSDPAFLEPFEEQHGVKINTKDYDSTNTAVTLLLTDPPGSWDVISLDVLAVPGLVESHPGIFDSLSEGDYEWANFYEPFMDPGSYETNGELYIVPNKFGWNAISYNGARVDPEDLRSFAAMWDGTYSGKIAVFDFYSQQIQTLALHLGKTAEEITEDDVMEIEEKLIAMKEQNGVIVSDVVGVQTALATGEADIIFGGGEWASGALNVEVPEIDWMVPDEGAVYYLMGFSLVGNSDNKETAREFIRYMMSAEGQAGLATSACFWGLPINTAAFEHLTDEQKKFLRIDDQAEYLARSHPTFYFDEDMDQFMLDSWSRFLQQ